MKQYMRHLSHIRALRSTTVALICLALTGSKRAISQAPSYACSEGVSIFEEVHNYKPLFDCSAVPGALTRDDLDVLGFRIGRSTLRDVEKRFPGSSSGVLTDEEEADLGICIKNKEGFGAVFASGVMGSPDTITAIYLAPARLIERRLSSCKTVDIPAEHFTTKSGIHVGIHFTQISGTSHRGIKTDGPFCAAYIIPSAQGPLLTNAEKHSKTNADLTDFTGVRGCMSKGKADWLALFGIASD
ncbi:MAG: hypothetical protein WCF30_16370 [Terracidiphilus sp.]